MVSWQELITIASVIGTICGIIFGYVGYKKGLKTDCYDQGEQQGSVRSDVRHIVCRLEDVLVELKEVTRSVGALSERVTRVEESAKQAHKRLNFFERSSGGGG